MPIRLVVAVAVLACSTPSLAAKGNKARAAACRQACGAAIQACIDGGGRPRKCTRSVRRSCRKNGLAVCVAPVAPETTYAVSNGGFDVAGCGSTDAPCATVQFIVDTLVPLGGAATIKVAAGTYDQSVECNAGTGADRAVVCIHDKTIWLLGGYVPPDWQTSAHDPSATIIDAKGAGRAVVAVRSGAAPVTVAFTMDGFTIQNGRAQGQSTGDMSKTWAFGGGMIAGNATLDLRRLSFRNNQAIGGSVDEPAGANGNGGALALVGNQLEVTRNATFTNLSFSSNHVAGGDGNDAGGYALGGALLAFGYTITGDGLVFTDNTAVAGNANGGGIAAGHKADALGGAVAASSDCIADLRHVHATGNVATGGNAPNGAAGGAFGGAFFAELASLTLSDAVIAGNLALGGNGRNDDGASSFAQGGAVMATLSTLTLDRVIVRGNEARAGDGAVHGGLPDGGGVAMTVGERDGVALPFTIRNSVIANNLVSVGAGRLGGGGGGGVFVQGATGTVEHTTIADNRLGEQHLLGAGVLVLPLVGPQTDVAFANGIFANHTSPSTGPQVYTNAALWVAMDASAAVTRTLFANNVHDTNAGIANAHNYPAGAIALSDVLGAAQAGFVSAGDPADDYHLTAGSPAVDQAIGSGVTIDLDGTARPTGAAPDLGAYELNP